MVQHGTANGVKQTLEVPIEGEGPVSEQRLKQKMVYSQSKSKYVFASFVTEERETRDLLTFPGPSLGQSDPTRCFDFIPQVAKP